MSMHTQRLRTLEATLEHVRCDTCREWPALAIFFDDAPLEHPAAGAVAQAAGPAGHLGEHAE